MPVDMLVNIRPSLNTNPAFHRAIEPCCPIPVSIRSRLTTYFWQVRGDNITGNSNKRTVWLITKLVSLLSPLNTSTIGLINPIEYTSKKIYMSLS